MCVHVCTYVYVYVCTYVYICTCICIHVYVCKNVRMSMWACVCKSHHRNGVNGVGLKEGENREGKKREEHPEGGEAWGREHETVRWGLV